MGGVNIQKTLSHNIHKCHLYVGTSSFYEKHPDIALADSNNHIIKIEK